MLLFNIPPIHKLTSTNTQIYKFVGLIQVIRGIFLSLQIIVQVSFANSLSMFSLNCVNFSIHFFDLLIVELEALLIALLLLLQILLQLSYLRF